MLKLSLNSLKGNVDLRSPGCERQQVLRNGNHDYGVEGHSDAAVTTQRPKVDLSFSTSPPTVFSELIQICIFPVEVGGANYQKFTSHIINGVFYFKPFSKSFISNLFIDVLIVFPPPLVLIKYSKDCHQNYSHPSLLTTCEKE